MSFKHAKAVTVKTTNGQVEMKDHGLIHLLNCYHCEINTKDFVIAWNQHCLNKYGYVLEIIDIAVEKALRNTVEITIHLKDKQLYSEDQGEDLYSTINSAIEKIWKTLNHLPN